MIIFNGPKTRADFLRTRRQRRMARFALWVAGGLIVAGAVVALWP